MPSITLSRATIASIPTSVLMQWFDEHGGTGTPLSLTLPCTAQQRATLEDRCLNLLDSAGLLRSASGLRYVGGQIAHRKVGEGMGEIVEKPDGTKVRRYTKTRTIESWTGGKWVNRSVRPVLTWDPTTLNNNPHSQNHTAIERRSSSSDAGIHSIDLLNLSNRTSPEHIHFPSIAACLRHMIATDTNLAAMDWTIAGKIRAMLLAKKDQARIREAMASTRAWLDRKPRSPRLFEHYTITLS